MTKKEEIKEYLMFHYIYDALEKYDNIEELNIILEIVIEKRYFYDVSTVLLKFPKNNKSDLFKLCKPFEVIRNSKNYMFNF